LVLSRRSLVGSMLATWLASGCADRSGTVPGRITIGTGPAGTLYNQIGTALATVTQRELDMASTARPYTGSSIYIPQLHRGELLFGLNNSADIGDAYRGEGVYARALDNLRAAMLLSRAPLQYFVRADSKITRLADLRGRPVVTRFRSIAPFDRINAEILATDGLAVSDVKQVIVAGVPEAIRALVDGRAEAAIALLGIPALREAHATIPGGIRVLSLGEAEARVTDMAGFQAFTLQPAPAMAGVSEPTRVVRMDVYLNAGVGVPADLVYRVVRTLHHNWSGLQEALPAFRSVPPGEVAPIHTVHPLHEGAARYFLEAGLTIASPSTAPGAAA
jgi:TRAP transporter TAXI family solute receptor